MIPTLFYKSLADDIRLKCLLLIAHEQELCVCELMHALNERSQPKVSRHLAQLKKAGILVDSKQKQWVFYALNPSLPDWALQVIKLTGEKNATFFTENLAKLASMGERPERVKVCCS
jgi:ArsR family transcriptional regulator